MKLIIVAYPITPVKIISNRTINEAIVFSI